MTSVDESWIDQPQPVRAGEGLELDALAAWLRAHTDLLGPPGVGSATIEVEQFPSGYSNLTYMLRLGATEVVLRRPPFGNTVATGHDMRREFTVLSKLAPMYPLAPRPLAYCDDPSVIGAPFYLMERRRGVVIRRRLPKGMTLDEAAASRLSTALIDGLAELHSLDIHAAGLTEFGKPDGYARRQVEGWTKRWNAAKTDELPQLDQVAAWLASSLPANADADAALIHNDYKYDNVLLDPADPSRIVGVLDWEMATIGSPRMDLGTTLGYWVEPGDDPRMQGLAFGPTNLPGSLTRAALIRRYEAQTGLEVGDGGYFRVFGLFKIAVIIQQIFARYRKGSTQDPRFAALGYFVGMLGEISSQAIDAG